MLHTYEKLLSELQEMKKVISGTIRISTIYSIGLHELPPYIKKFLHDYPSVNVRVEYRRSNLVYEDILHNSVDFGLVAFPVKVRQIEMRSRSATTTSCSSRIPAPAGEAREVEVKALAGHKFIGFDPDIPTRKAVDQIFRENKLEIEPVMEFDNIETVKRAVEIDHGIAIVPQATVLQEVKQGTLAAAAFQGKGVHPAARHPPPQGPRAHAGDEEIHRDARHRQPRLSAAWRKFPPPLSSIARAIFVIARWAPRKPPPSNSGCCLG
jgi:DNA-binding transcriptional LysR family regulator